ncbi:restriction endonuclease subunit S [Rhizobium sp. R86522]|uniref:restriction endonuclease subunit S n=1 Tax=Rhizobium sp. R86522 TaxID=3093861 RepID=UPI00366D291A
MTMHNGLVDQADKFKKRVASENTSAYKIVSRGQLVVGFPIDEGVLSFQKLYDEAIVSPAYAVWDVYRSDVDDNYLEKFLRSPIALKFYANKLRSTTARRRSIPQDTFLELPVPLPPLAEQKRIAAILDKADALRAKRRQAIALLDSLTQSIFLEMFGDPVSNPKGWPTFKLSDVAEFFAGNSLPEGLEFKRQVGGYLQLKVSDLNLAENAEHVVIAASFSDKPGSRSGTAPAGAIVFPKRGGAIATNKKRTLARPAILDPNLMGVAPKPQHLNSPFLAAWFKFLDLASISSGSSVPQLNKQDLAPLDISVPPLQLQEVYKARKDQLSENVSHGSASLFASDRLFTTLQHRAFTGQL